jgi:hypothetical protein
LIGHGGVAHISQQSLRYSWNTRPIFVVDRIAEPLLTAQIAFRGLNPDMTGQELNLLKLPACLVTQTGTGTTKIVRRNPIQTAFRGPGLHDAPDRLRTESARPDSVGLVNRPKKLTC